MEAHYQNRMENFIISRAFILLLISIFLFPLIILITPSTTLQSQSWSCDQELPSYFTQASIRPSRKTSKEAHIALAKSSVMQTYTLSFLAWLGATHSLIGAKEKKEKEKHSKTALDLEAS